MSENNRNGSPNLNQIFLWFFVQIGICIIGLAYYKQKLARIVRIEDMISKGLLQKLQSDRKLLKNRSMDTAMHSAFKTNLVRFKMRCLSFARHLVFSLLLALVYAMVSFFTSNNVSQGLYVATGISILINVVSFLVVLFSFTNEKNSIKEIDIKIKSGVFNRPRQEAPIPLQAQTYSQPMYANHPQDAQDFQPHQQAFSGGPGIPAIVTSAPQGFDDHLRILDYSQSPASSSPQQPAVKFFQKAQYQYQASAPSLAPEAYATVPEANLVSPFRKSVAPPEAFRKSVAHLEQVSPQFRKSEAQPPNPFKVKKHEKGQSSVGLDPNNTGISPRIGAYKFQAKDLVEKGVYIYNENYLNGAPIIFKLFADYSGVITIEVGPVGMKGENCTVMIEELEEMGKETVELLERVKFNRLALIKLLNEKFF